MTLLQSLYFAMPVAAQNAAVSAYGYYLKRKRWGSQAGEIRDLIVSSKSWTRDQVTAYQTSRLTRILRHCALEIPYYRDQWTRARLDVTGVRNVEDLPYLPILPKETVRRVGPELVHPRARPYWTQHTSGSTGTPVVVHLNRHTYQLVHALLEDQEQHCGIGMGDLRATFAGRMVQPADRLTPPFWRYNRAQRQILFSAYHLTKSTLPYYVEELARRQPAELIGYPSAISLVAMHINASRQQGLVRPRAVITNSETLLEWQRAAMEEAFRCPVRDYYGSAEALVFAAQCSAGTYHFHPLLGIAEIVGTDGLPVRPGEPGRLVCTTLVNDVMPLVRYEIGDLAIRLPTACECGSSLDGAREILGRCDDMIVTPDGRFVGRLDHVFKGVRGIRECQLVQEEVNLIRLVMVADDGFDSQQEQLLRQNVAARLGEAVRLEVCRVREIARTRAGKFSSVVSRIKGTSTTADLSPVTELHK